MNNNQLTIEQLKSLEVGDWVWVELLDDDLVACWVSGTGRGFYCEKIEDTKNEDSLAITYDGERGWLDFSDYGTVWVAYKNKEDVNRGTCEFCIHNMQKGCYNNGVNNPKCEYMNLYLRADEYCTRFEAERRLAELTKE